MYDRMMQQMCSDFLGVSSSALSSSANSNTLTLADFDRTIKRLMDEVRVYYIANEHVPEVDDEGHECFWAMNGLGGQKVSMLNSKYLDKFKTNCEAAGLIPTEYTPQANGFAIYESRRLEPYAPA